MVYFASELIHLARDCGTRVLISGLLWSHCKGISGGKEQIIQGHTFYSM